MSLLSLRLIARHSHVCPPISKEGGSRSSYRRLYIEFWVHLFFHKLSESLKTACNRAGYRISEFSDNKKTSAEAFISLSINCRRGFKSLVTTLVIALEKLLNLSLLTLSFPINYRQSIKSAAISLVIVLRKFKNLKSVCLFSFP